LATGGWEGDGAARRQALWSRECGGEICRSRDELYAVAKR